MKFRGMTEQGEWVEGHYVRNTRRDEFLEEQSLIYPIDSSEIFEIIPESLAMSTGKLDKNGKEIFGSIELEDGTMSKGGDILLTGYNAHQWVIWDLNLGQWGYVQEGFVGKVDLGNLAILVDNMKSDKKAKCQVIGNQMDFDAGKEK